MAAMAIPTDVLLTADMAGRDAPASHDHVLRNQAVGSTCSVSAWHSAGHPPTCRRTAGAGERRHHPFGKFFFASERAGGRLAGGERGTRDGGAARSAGEGDGQAGAYSWTASSYLILAGGGRRA